MDNLIMKIKKLRDNCIIPKQTNKEDAGWDCYVSELFIIDGKNKKMKPWREVMNKEAAKKGDEDVAYVSPHRRICCGLGFAAELPEGWYAQIVPRSGLAIWKGITITNSPGTIDNGYRNEWTAIVVNTSDETVEIKIGDAICQFMLKKSPDMKIEVVETLSESNRGTAGFGSSDKKTEEEIKKIKFEIYKYIEIQNNKKIPTTTSDIGMQFKINPTKIIDEMCAEKSIKLVNNTIERIKNIY